MTVLRFPLDRARPTKAGRIVCCEDAAVLVLPVVRVERGAVWTDFTSPNYVAPNYGLSDYATGGLFPDVSQ